MDLVVKYMVNNDCYKSGRKIIPKGIMVHSTATPSIMASAWFDRWNKSGIDACVHAFVDDKMVLQCLPWNHRGWHAGSGKLGSANNTHISFEICEPAGFKYGQGSTMIGYDVKAQEEYFNKVYKNAIDVAVMLCKEFNLTEKDIICHSEGYKLGIATNHGDVMHWFPKHGKSMDTFRADVAKILNVKPIEPIKPVIPTPINNNVLSYQKLTVKLAIKDRNEKLLVCDGILGANTQSTYEKMPVLKVGSKGEAVKWLQDILGANPVDGHFGSITNAKVISFQRAKGLVADGIVGKNTWKTLVEG